MLPTEAERELAARAGLDGAAFTWGEELAPGGRMMANFWQGEFPWQNVCSDGLESTSPVERFAPNGYGLFDMAGNVWEWTDGYFTRRHSAEAERACCVPHNPRARDPSQSLVAGEPGRAHSSPRDQGRITPLCAQLLPSRPACGTSGRGVRQIDSSHRFPLRVAALLAGVSVAHNEIDRA